MRFSLLALASLVTVAAFGCGGKVVFSQDSSGGAGGTGSTTVSTGKGVTTATGTSSTTNVSSSTGIDPGLCAKFCTVAASCVMGGCNQQCQQLLQTPGCQSEAAAYISCVTASFDAQQCTLPQGACQNEENALANCQGPPPPPQCQGGNCSGDGQSCSCQGQCFGQQVATKCTLLPSPMCQCFANGQFVGTCTQGGGNACDLNQGCCSTYFLPQPGG